MIEDIDPNIWGKHFWKTSHYITASYPNNPTIEHKQHVRQYFELLQFLLPCLNCRNHYKLNLKNYPLTDDILNSKEKLVEWLIELHNEVNKRTGKTVLSVEKAKKLYSVNNNSVVNYNRICTIILIIFLIIILIGYIKYTN
jgi:hypothetical protein